MNGLEYNARLLLRGGGGGEDGVGGGLFGSKFLLMMCRQIGQLPKGAPAFRWDVSQYAMHSGCIRCPHLS
jgi:hypothetical protein